MKTIKFIEESIKLMQLLQLPADIKIGTFTIKSTGSLVNWAGKSGEFTHSEIKFTLIFRPDHIEGLKKMGVKIDLKNCKMNNLSPTALRFKSGREAIKQGRYAPYYYEGNPNNAITGVMENWIDAPASCSLSTLLVLDDFCRENHRNELALHNDTVLATNGWRSKTKYSQSIPIESQYHNIKAIRINAHAKKYENLLPIEKRVLKMN
jgi:hypothetical protein